MTAMWIMVGVAIVITMAVWRLRKASARLDRILREEAAQPAESETETLPASHNG